MKRVLLAAAAIVAGCSLAHAQEAEPDAPVLPVGEDPVTIRVLMPDGSPAAGAEVGFSIQTRASPGAEMVVEVTPADGKTGLTDASGSLRLAQDSALFDGGRTRPYGACAITQDRSMIGVVELTREAAAAGAPLVIRLAPSCRLTVRVGSAELEGMGRAPAVTNSYVWWGQTRIFGCERVRNGVHEFLLPPGEFRVFAYGTDAADRTAAVSIAPGERSRTLEIDLPASRIARLVGQPAPELKSIKGWTNGEPASLAELRGRVVLLDFWGTWCGPCLGAMPELMEAHDRYAADGLVIIAVHDDSAASVRELEERMVTAQRVWGGRPLPFRVALDGGGETPIPGGDEGATASGATTAEYGVTTFPTQVLIGRDGNVVGRREKGEKDQLPALMRKAGVERE